MPYYIKDPKRDPNFDNHPYVMPTTVTVCKAPVALVTKSHDLNYDNTMHLSVHLHIGQRFL